MNTLFVYNKKAGNKFKSTLINEIKANLPSKFQSEFVEIQKFDTFKTNDFECLVAVGGDGTVNTVAKRACIEKKVLAIIPHASILPTIHTHFNPIEERPYGGNLLMHVLKDISHHFIEIDSEKKEILNSLFEFEDKYLESNSSDFVFGIYQLKKS